MNRSFNKIRHIQESNKLLEKRMLTEDESAELEQAQQQLKNENLEIIAAGIPPINMETLEKFDSGEDVSAEENEINIPSPDVDEKEKESLKEQLRSKICTATKGELKDAKTKLLAQMKNKKNVQEQVIPITILGITAAPAVFLAIAGFILMLILVRLIRWLSNRDRGGYGCRGRESWGGLMRRINRPN